MRVGDRQARMSSWLAWAQHGRQVLRLRHAGGQIGE